MMRKGLYIWEEGDWPHFRWDGAALLQPLGVARRKQGELLGAMQGLGFELRQQAQLEALTEEVLKSSEIEGEQLDKDSVRSSIARQLGIEVAAADPEDRRVEGVVQMLLDATQRFDQPLTIDRLFGWQAALFPTGYSGMRRVRTAAWRNDADGPMRVVSGGYGNERVHFEAPPADRVGAEMERFLEWYARRDQVEGLVRAGLAHLWFVTIHPFEDGNGRVARAIADQALAQSEGSPHRFYSMSSQIRLERRAYYEQLEATQKRDMDVTAWLVWFLECLARALDGATATSQQVLRKAEFWRRHHAFAFNPRQRLVLNRFLDGFDGHLTARKWAALTKKSLPTAQRDIAELVDGGVLVRNEGGSKNTTYRLA